MIFHSTHMGSDLLDARWRTYRQVTDLALRRWFRDGDRHMKICIQLEVLTEIEK